MVKIKQGATLVLFNDNTRKEVFLVFRSDYPIWVTTGGGTDKGETPRKAAVREAVEETGFKVKIVRSVGVYTDRRGQTLHRSHLFEGRVVSGKFRPEFPGCKGKWFKVNKLPLSMTDRTREKILDCAAHTTGYFKKKGRPLTLKNNLPLLFLHPISVIKYIFLAYSSRRP